MTKQTQFFAFTLMMTITTTFSFSQSKAIEQIKSNFQKQEACWNRGDHTCYMLAYSRNEMIQTISRGGITKGYDQILNDYKTYFPRERMGELHFDQMEFRKLSAKFYYVIGRFNLTYKNRDEVHQGYFSVLMKKERDGWFIVSDHSS